MNASQSNLLSSIIIRKANRSDCLDIFRWRNDRVMRGNSILGPRKVTLSEHKRWFNEKLKDPSAIMYMAISRNRKVGFLRFNVQEDSVEISINVNPDFRGVGIGRKIITLSSEKVFKKIAIPIIARIKNNNVASKIAFKRCGYKHKNRDNKVTTLCFDPKSLVA